MSKLVAAMACLGLFASLSSAALGAASTQPFPQAPVDPQLRNATPYLLSLKAFDQCLIVQSRLLNTTREAVHTPCSCYAKATIAGMNKEELDFMRANGFFSDTTRPKALANIDRCKLKRPDGV
jgi:hypothetical protein